jgi:hypothetical protein
MSVNSHHENDIVKNSKSFKIIRKNVNMTSQNSSTSKLATSGLASLSSLPKNNSEFRKSSETRLN